jgi:site-specific recombinase XerD
VESFLTHLAVAGKVAASTQNQAKSALLFLYREVLEIELPWLDNVTQAKAPKRLPVVLTVGEVQAMLSRLSGTHGLIAGLLYGTGMRLMEAIRLRVKDVEFSRREIVVREGKGFKDRVTMLPEALSAPLKVHLVKVKALHEDSNSKFKNHLQEMCLSINIDISYSVSNSHLQGNVFHMYRAGCHPCF